MHSPKKAILLSLVISILLLVVKFAIYFYTQSNAILTDAAESIVNVIAGGFAFYSIYLSELPKDENHPYGHGKVAFFSVFLEGLLIMIAGIIIAIKSAFSLVFNHQEITAVFEGAFYIGATGLVNLILGYYLIFQSKKHQSIILEGDGKHILTDAISSAGLMCALLLIHFTSLLWLDSVVSILLSIYIIYNGYCLFRKSIAGLMDESNPIIVNEVIAVLQKNRKNDWIDVHNLRTQQYGTDLHIDCHVTLPYYYDLVKVHQEISAISETVNANSKHPVEFFIHTDPCLPNCCVYCAIKNCEVRTYDFEELVNWNLDNLTKNKKHF